MLNTVKAQASPYLPIKLVDRGFKCISAVKILLYLPQTPLNSPARFHSRVYRNLQRVLGKTAVAKVQGKAARL